MRSALRARPSKLLIRSPSGSCTRQRVAPWVPVWAPVDRVAQLVGVQTGKEGAVWLTAPSASMRAKFGRIPSAANFCTIGVMRPSMPYA